MQFRGRHAPHAGGAVVGAGENAAAVGRKRDAPERPFVTVEGQEVAAACGMPEVQAAIGTHTRDPGAIG